MRFANCCEARGLRLQDSYILRMKDLNFKPEKGAAHGACMVLQYVLLDSFSLLYPVHAPPTSGPFISVDGLLTTTQAQKQRVS